VEVGNGFTAVGAVVDDETKAAGEVEFPGENAGGEKEVAEERLVGGDGFANARNGLLRDDQQVNGSLGLDVVQDEAEVVLVFDLGGNFAVDDALEEGLRHGGEFTGENGGNGELSLRDSRRAESAGRRRR
jgi:hypothetical protein